MFLNLFLFRHGSTQGNLDGRYAGSTDEDLCDAGIKEVENSRNTLLAGHDIKSSLFKDFQNENSVVFVSPMKRAKHTAEIFFPNARKVIVDDFAEMRFGLFEDKTAEEMSKDTLLGPLYKAWIDGNCIGKCPGEEGESKESFSNRVCSAFEKLCSGLKNENKLKDGDNLVIISHGGTIMALLERFSREKKSYFDWRTEHAGYRYQEIEL
ncbi:MAG: histidine phosphatase family protein [Treponema sp.]|nr:histidine phosphatase family protein [Treponema sp.]